MHRDRLKHNWSSLGFGILSFVSGVFLFFFEKDTYEGFELMSALTLVCFCLPSFNSLFNWRMLFLSLVIITPASLFFQFLAVKNQIWVYGDIPYYLGQIHWGNWEMPWMEVVFYFLFPIFQLGLFAFFCTRFPPRPLIANISKIFPILLFSVPLLFLAQWLFFQLNPWQSASRPIDWNCAIMGTAFLVTLVTYALNNAYRRFVRSAFFAAWTLGMGTYMLLWEQFHTVLHDHWRYVLNHCVLPPWVIIDAERGLGLSQAQLYGYFMTATVFPAIVFLVGHIWKNALQPKQFE